MGVGLLVGLGQADAAIVSSSGDLTILPLPPVSVVEGALESDTEFFVFQEEGAASTPALEAVLVSPSMTFTGDAIPTPGMLVGGTLVDTYLVHADRVGTGAGITHSGSVTFESDILAVMVTTSQLIDSDASIGNPGTTYGTSANRGLENPGDVITISADLRTLTVQLFHGGAEDHVRVVTEAAPAVVPVQPMTWLLGPALLGVGWTGLRRQRPGGAVRRDPTP